MLIWKGCICVILILKMQIRAVDAQVELELLLKRLNRIQSRRLFWPDLHFIMFIVCGKKGIYLRVWICVIGVLFISLGLRTHELPSAETTRPGRRQEHLLHSCMIGIFVTDKTVFLPGSFLRVTSIKGLVYSHKKYFLRNILFFALLITVHPHKLASPLCVLGLYFSRVFISLGSRLRSVEGWL